MSELLAGVSAGSRADVKRVHQLIRKTAPELRPFVMGRMLGYGKFHYRYASGREGDSAVIALAERVGGLALYINSIKGDRYLAESYARRLGNVSVGKSCIRFKKIADLNEAALLSLIRDARAFGGAGRA
ncbi:MAG TPA: DUF1801 domain-containing protein [Candidatus Limnocylindrales bacterium]|nr:DUF1801 domain-containing protein [Candidatus Limnocylindrales bacterium]